MVYGIRLVPEGSVKALEDAKLTLAGGEAAGLTLHTIDGTIPQLRRALDRSLDAFFDLLPGADEEDREDALTGQSLDVPSDGEEDITRGGAVGDAEGEAEVAVEIASSEGDVVAVGEADGMALEGVADGAGHAGLAGAGLTGDDGVLALLDALDEIAHEALFAGRQPELVVVDVLGAVHRQGAVAPHAAARVNGERIAQLLLVEGVDGSGRGFVDGLRALAEQPAVRGAVC